MTLQRQLLIFTLTLCFVLFAGVWVYQLQSTRTFLEEQLAVHAQDTATSLALSISPLVAAGDVAAVETMMNAIFDRGYYRDMIFSDMDGKAVVRRTVEISVDQVPGWFIRLIPLDSPPGESQVMNGWVRAGSLRVQSHPGYAYQTLWQTFIRISGHFLLTGLVVFIVGSISLKFLLKPLRRVERQAEAICRQEYEIQQKIPTTRELKSVVASMNRMTSKVRDMFEEQAATAERLRNSVYRDPLTGLGNRRFLEARIDGSQDGEARTVKGAFLFVQIHHLQTINDERGYGAGDDLIKRAAEIIVETLGEEINYAAARLSGGDFCVFLPHADKKDAGRLAERISAHLSSLSAESLSLSEDICSLGGVFYSEPCSLRHLLSKADTALAKARHEGLNQWLLEPAHCDEDAPTQGKTWWKKNLAQSLANRAIRLYGQRVVRTGTPSEVIHLELFSRITVDPGEEVPAATFVPLVEQAAVVTELDRRVVELMLDSFPAWNEPKLAVNISVRSLLDDAFTDWLSDRLRRIAEGSLTIYFELSESGVASNIDAVSAFNRRLSALGHRIGIDHFGGSFSNFGYLKSLRPAYVKIDRTFTSRLEAAQSDAMFYIGTLRSIAHSLDIKVIGERVETEEQLSVFRDLQVDGFQGFLVEQPRLLTSKV